MTKRLLWLVLTLATAWGVRAQGSNLLSQVDSLANEAENFLEAKDYPAAVACYDRLDVAFAALPDSVRQAYSHYLGDQGYNAACVYALVGRKSDALQWFERFTDAAIDRREIDYGWICRDPNLDPVRDAPRFRAALKRLAAWGDYRQILRSAPAYGAAGSDSAIRFTYAAPADPNLVRVREYFRLDSVAGAGDELSKIRRLMTWVHNTVCHDGSSPNPELRNALSMVELCRREGRGVNCRMMAQILNECYLAMGFKSRFVTCLPRTMVCDCHVINAVYSVTLGKWVWMDPTFNAWVTDENGVLLSIAEVRQRIIDGRPCFLNEDANWNNRARQTKEQYLDHYMAKNLYYLDCPLRSEFNTETQYEGKPAVRYRCLAPAGDSVAGATCDAASFWRSPYDEQ